MEVLLSLITSGSISYIVILVLVFGIIITLYKMHMNSLNNEVERATQKNIIKQLEQNVKDKDLQLQNAQELMNKKSEILNQVIQERSELEEKLKKLEIDIEKKVSVGQNRPASNILKDVFKSLGNQK